MQKKLPIIILENIPIYLLSVAFFFCVTRYNGIVIDGILYTLQAINYLEPQRFQGDISFIYGNQDSYSIFTPFYAFLLKTFNIDLGSKICCIFGHLLFAIAFASLAINWAKLFHCKKFTQPIILIFFLLYCSFGESRSVINGFYYVEPYVTPRTISVSLGIFGLSLLFKKKVASLICFILGTTIHPLMAGWGLPLWLFYYYPKSTLPISIISLLFPLTVLIGKTPFSAADSLWNAFYKNNLFFNFCTFLSFFLYCWKFSTQKKIQRFSKSIFFVVAIALYWLIVGIETNFILLNQFQVFRIEWLCITATAPLFFIILFEKYTTSFRNTNPFAKDDLILLLFPIIFWIDSIFIDAFLLCFIFSRKIFSKKIICASRISHALLILCTICLAAVTIVLHTNIESSSKILLHNYEMQIAFALTIIVLLRHIFFEASPILSLFLLSFICLCNSIQEDLQFTENYSNTLALLAATIIWVSLPAKGLFYRIVPLCWLIPFGITHYDHRSIEKRNAEEQINISYKHFIFPEISNRGKILFSVENHNNAIPRLHFLSGAYLDYQSQTGGIFFREQHIQASHRYNMLFFKDSSYQISSPWDDNFVKRISDLHNPSNLTSTVKFLCETNEISHLVTDISELNFPIKSKSFAYSESTPLFLYSCY